MNRLPPSASIATPTGDGTLTAPSALRNIPAIVALMREVAPARGRALEIACGTGQHVTALAGALPGIDWQPSEIAPDRIASIDAYGAQSGLGNLRPALLLDATLPGWAAQQQPYDLVYMGNLLHLISEEAASAVVTEAARAVAPEGLLAIYGPFRRAGVLTSEGDATFDAELRAADPAIGYKDDGWLLGVLTAAGLAPADVRQMPANNLAFLARRRGR